jgi:hypothetical protein
VSEREFHWTDHARLFALFAFFVGLLFVPLLAVLGYAAVMVLLDQYDDDTESEPTATNG